MNGQAQNRHKYSNKLVHKPNVCEWETSSTRMPVKVVRNLWVLGSLPSTKLRPAGPLRSRPVHPQLGGLSHSFIRYYNTRAYHPFHPMNYRHQHRVIYEDTVTIDNTIKSTIQTVHRPIDLLLVLGQKIILFFPLPHYNYKLSSIWPFPLECKSHWRTE